MWVLGDGTRDGPLGAACKTAAVCPGSTQLFASGVACATCAGIYTCSKYQPALQETKVELIKTLQALTEGKVGARLLACFAFVCSCGEMWGRRRLAACSGTVCVAQHDSMVFLCCSHSHGRSLTPACLARVCRFMLAPQIYVEIERARLTRQLARMKEEEGAVQEAAEILQEVAVVSGRGG